MNILITGVAGFIGFHLTNRLLREDSNKIIGIDDVNNYYDVDLKEYRLSKLKKYSNFKFIKGSISDKEFLDNVFNGNDIDIVVNLAAQAGVRYSIVNPDTYIESNIVGFYNVLEMCRKYPVKHFIYASSSSIYGDNKKVPFSELDKTESPVSLYAATKKSDELLAYSYSKLYSICSTGLRFFTVYGPCGRPDMAYFSFTNKLVAKEKIKLYNYGKCERDFTYVDDVVECIYRVIKNEPKRDFSVYNIGCSNPEQLLDFVHILSEELKSSGVLEDDFNIDDYTQFIEKQNGDVDQTFADTSLFFNDYDYVPNTSLREGLREFSKWYKDYYKINK